MARPTVIFALDSKTDIALCEMSHGCMGAVGYGHNGSLDFCFSADRGANWGNEIARVGVIAGPAVVKTGSLQIYQEMQSGRNALVVHCVGVVPVSGAIPYLSTGTDYLWRSEDMGYTWVQVLGS